MTGYVGTSLLDEIPTLGNTKESLTEAVKVQNVRQYLTNCTYLQDELIELYDLKIYGTPWYIFFFFNPIHPYAK